MAAFYQSIKPTTENWKDQTAVWLQAERQQKFMKSLQFLQARGWNNEAVCTMLPSYTVEEGEDRLWKAIFLTIKPIISLTALYIRLADPVLKSLPAL